jgi:hypothetical protein
VGAFQYQWRILSAIIQAKLHVIGSLYLAVSGGISVPVADTFLNTCTFFMSVQFQFHCLILIQNSKLRIDKEAFNRKNITLDNKLNIELRNKLDVMFGALLL